MDGGLDSYGFTLERETFLGSGVYEAIGKLRDVNGAPKLDRDEEDATHHGSDDEIEETEPTIGRIGSTSFKVVYDSDDPTHAGSQSMLQDWYNKVKRHYRAYDPQGVEVFRCVGWVKSIGRDYPVKGLQGFDVTVRWARAPRALA